MKSSGRRLIAPLVLLAAAACASSSNPAGGFDPPAPPPSADAPRDAAVAAIDAWAPSADAAGAVDAGPPLASVLLAEAMRELGAMRSSSYTHDTSVDEAHGVFNYDCSGFVTYALGRAVPAALQLIEQAKNTTRPDAAMFEAFLEKPTGRWRHVARAMDLVPGDVVAWLEPKEIISTNTGHVMIVHAAVSPHPTRADAFLVPVIDSTESPHGPTDSRAPSGSGLGTGTMVLHTDVAGTPLGYQWSDQSVSTEYATAIALGHLD